MANSQKPIYVVLTARDGTIGCHLSASQGKGKPPAQRLIGDSRAFDSTPAGNVQALVAVLNVLGKTRRPLVIITDNAATIRLLRGSRVPKKHEALLKQVANMLRHRGTTIKSIRAPRNGEAKAAWDILAQANATGKRVDKIYNMSK